MLKRPTLFASVTAFVLGCSASFFALAQSRDPGPLMSVAQAHAKAVAGEIVLVDVRTPEEWRETGLPASAHAITMHQDPKAFVQKLLTARGSDTNRPLAIICRTGNRTTGLLPELKKAGFANVVNVAEGVVGGPYGKGWLRSGLPTRPGTNTAAPTFSSAPKGTK